MTDFPDAARLDRVAEALTKVVASSMPEIMKEPEAFYLVSARTGQSWSLGTGRHSEWFRETQALIESTARREALLDAAASYPTMTRDMVSRDSVQAYLTGLAWGDQ